jgi:hypothetical protein
MVSPSEAPLVANMEEVSRHGAPLHGRADIKIENPMPTKTEKMVQNFANAASAGQPGH